MKRSELKSLIKESIEEIQMFKNAQLGLDRADKMLLEKYGIPIPTAEQRIEQRKKLMEELEKDPVYIKIKQENIILKNSLKPEEYRRKKLQDFRNFMKEMFD